jgi:hypothetical protein
MLPLYNTKTFSQIYPDYDSFKYTFDNEFDEYGKNCISANSLKTLYWLLYARYADNPIVNYSVDNFKAKIVSITYQRGPTWERKLALQKSLRDLSEADLLTGARTIFNRALHPETAPGTDTDTELTYINSQDVSKNRRSKLDAYSYLQDVLKNDITEEFIRQYAKLFSKFVSPNITRIYENDVEEED